MKDRAYMLRSEYHGFDVKIRDMFQSDSAAFLWEFAMYISNMADGNIPIPVSRVESDKQDMPNLFRNVASLCNQIASDIENELAELEENHE